MDFGVFSRDQRTRHIAISEAHRLEVENILKTGEEYTGQLIVRTNNPQKPELEIIVNRN